MDNINKSNKVGVTRTNMSMVEVHQGETIAYNASFDHLKRLVAFSDATIATTLPRGGLQIIQPRQTDPSRMRLYSRQMFSLDAPAWQAMSHGKAVASATSSNKNPRLTATAWSATCEAWRPVLATRS